MRVGLTWQLNKPEDEALVREIRPAVTKWSHEPLPGLQNTSGLEGKAAHIRDEFGAESIVDLRTEPVQTYLEWAAQYPGDIYKWFADWCHEVVLETRGAVRDWELWGEAACPYTGKGFVEADGTKLHEGMTYAGLIERVSEAIHAADPNARVLLGGHGCDMDLRFWRELRTADALRFADVNNLHPFLMRVRGADSVMDCLRTGLDEMSDGTPFVATEFGWPTQDGAAVHELTSHVTDRVLSVGCEQAAEWTDLCFELFEERGFEYVVVCGLRDTPGKSHWGSKLGIVTHDGSPKGAYYTKVREWIDRGQ